MISILFIQSFISSNETYKVFFVRNLQETARFLKVHRPLVVYILKNFFYQNQDAG
jgi:hypothetical protein